MEELGFTAIAVESGLPESRLIYDFVAGGPGTTGQVLREGFSCGPGDTQENEELIRWIREYNANAAHAPQSPVLCDQRGPLRQGTPLAYENALTYLSQVDPASGQKVRATLKPYLDRLSEGDAKPLSQAESDGLSAAIEDLLALLERERPAYVAATSEINYQWAHRNVMTARQSQRQNRVRPTPPPGGGLPPSAWLSLSQRSSAMADNVRWVIERGARGEGLCIRTQRTREKCAHRGRNLERLRATGDRVGATSSFGLWRRPGHHRVLFGEKRRRASTWIGRTGRPRRCARKCRIAAFPA